MRAGRTAGLLALYVGAQLVALVLAAPFISAGLRTTSNPNSPTGPLFLIVAIIVAPLAILLLARFAGGLTVLRTLILLGIAASLDLTLSPSLAPILPPGVYLPPVFNLGFAFFFADVIASLLAVSMFLALLIEPQWFVVDLVGFVAGGSLIALLGISFAILPVFILLGALAIYDAIAVYGTKHMVSLADVVTELKLPILMVMPSSGGFDYTTRGTLTEQRAKPVEEREAVFMGLGDVVIPGALVVSSFVWLPHAVTPFGVGANLVVALSAMLGSLVGYAVLMRLIRSGNAQAGLPFLNGGAIGGYAVAFVLLFHNFGLGLNLGL